MNPQELESHIADCGRLFMKAYAENDFAMARHWLQLQAVAIASRSPEQVARQSDCYFPDQGDKARIDAQWRNI